MTALSPAGRGRTRLAGTRLWLCILVICLGLAAVPLIVLGSRGAEKATAPPAVEGNVTAKLGVFRETQPAAVAAFDQWLGRPVDIAVDFSARATWDDIASPTYLLEAWQGSGYQLSLGVALLPADQNASIAEGATGAYDAYFLTLAQGLVDYGHADAILRLGWEFNVPGMLWATSDTRAFIAYWRRIVTAMRGVQGQQFRFDWNLNNQTQQYDAIDYYPGDDVVDYVGVDAYDVAGRAGTYPYPSDCDDDCRLERQQAAWSGQIYGGERGLNFWSQFASQHGKQLSLPEWGLWERLDGTGGGENPYYIQQIFDFVATAGDDVAYFAYFEYDGADGEHSLTMSFPESAAIFKRRWSSS